MTTTPNLPGPERVKSCREFLLYMGENGNLVEKEYAADLLAILDSLPALGADNIRLQAENERLDIKIIGLEGKKEQHLSVAKRWREAEAELAAARPLIEAVMRAPIGTNPLNEEIRWIDPEYLTDEIEPAALAFREKAEKAGEKGEGKQWPR